MKKIIFFLLLISKGIMNYESKCVDQKNQETVYRNELLVETFLLECVEIKKSLTITKVVVITHDILYDKK